MCLKYASGAKSFVSAMSFIIYHDLDEWTRRSSFDPYYIAVMIFAFFSLMFSFGNIENSKVLQIVTGFCRLITIIFMYGGTIYYLSKDGTHMAAAFDKSYLNNIANAFGNTVFAFIFHHSISGIVYPIRPQSDIRPMFKKSHAIGASLLGIEGILSWIAFSGLTNKCHVNKDLGQEPHYPCAISDLFNENFIDIPFIGEVCNFYPMLNVSSVPVLTITLRNNLMEVIPIKKWLSRSDNAICKFLLEDQRKIVKGIWSIIISIPVLCIVIPYSDPQTFITYTGGICGTFILLIFPLTLVWHARKKDIEKTHGVNFNKSPF